MGGFFSLLLLGTLMFVACVAVQLIPLRLSFSPLLLRKALALSVGLLAGTAIAVVVPEGIELLVKDEDAISWRVPLLFVIGFPVLLGFVVMYIVDHHEVIQRRFFTKGGDAISNAHPYLRSILSTPLTLSLLLHSCVDGFALGVSTLDERSSMRYIFYFMIILHKLPTALSFSVVLVKQGMAPDLIYAHIVAFSFATPIASLAAYPLAKVALSGNAHLALLLLFSSGTFLYSVVHLLLVNPEANDYSELNTDRENGLNGQSEQNNGINDSMNNDRHTDNELNTTEEFSSLVLTVTGMLVPLIFSLAGID